MSKLSLLKKSLQIFGVYYQVVLKNFSYQFFYLLGIAGYTIFGSVLLGLLLKHLVDQLMLNQSPESVTKTFSYFIGAYLLLMLLNMAFRFLADQSITRGILDKYMYEFEWACFRKLHSKGYDFFSNSHTGALVSKAQRFVDSYVVMDFSLTRGVFEIIILYLSSLVVLGYYNLYLPIIFIAFSGSFLALYFYMLPKKVELDLKVSQARSLVTARLADTLINFLNLKIFNSYQAELKHYTGLLINLNESTKRSWYYSIRMYFSQAILILIFELGVFYFTYRLYLSQQVSLGTVILLFTYLGLISSHLIRLGNEFKNITRALSSASEMVDIFKSPDDENIDFQSTVELPKPQSVNIKFQHVNFTYQNGKEVFNNFCLDIPAKQTLGIVGASGAGKTSLFKMLLGFTKATTGEVLFNDLDIKKFEREQFSQYLSFVPQEPQLFHRTILENITYGSEIKDIREIKAACEKAYISKMIERLPNGFDTVVGERGIKLSTGEKQRITLARAFLNNCPVLLLDEPTSALDSESEHYVQLALKELFKDRTVIVVAHRLATIKMLDRIIVLADGQIVEDGNHQTLLAGMSSNYEKLWNLQTASGA